MTTAINRLRAAAARLAALRRCRRGGVALNFALVAPALLIAAGMAVDYAQMTDLRRKMQEAADAAALAAARELRLANTDPQRARELAQKYVDAHLAARGLTGYTVNASVVASAPSTQPPAGGGGAGGGGGGGGGTGGGGYVDMSMKTSSTESALSTPGVAAPAPAPAPAPVAGGTYNGVAVHVAFPVQGAFSQLLNRGQTTLNARAEARLTGGMPLCMIGLDGTNKAVSLDKTSRLEAPGCSIYSDSTDPAGLSVVDSASLRSGFTCSAGGMGGGAANYSPLPQLDCPPMPDPLAARPPPSYSACDYQNLTITGLGFRTLLPGVYCGGLKISGGQYIQFAPGEYVIKDGPLDVSGVTILRGTNIGFYLVGEASVIKFTDAATIEFTAPKTGPMAGILFFEDRAASIGRKHEVASDFVRVLLGTLYFPRGHLRITSRYKVGDMSAYTIIVARRLELSGAPALYLNAAYSSTDVPVPAGLGPNGGSTRLTR
ncbi:MAG: pilus assembly protein [Methylobacteriaceae bacterium]|nr:pilus assembly protein [Methylobacteriaceae bacterium]